MTSFLRSDRSRSVAVWLFAVAALVLAMVVVGGATRLTDSGLSITQWEARHRRHAASVDPGLELRVRPLSRDPPQYEQVNQGMSLGEFKTIYWWEWSHRLLGRLVGAAFAPAVRLVPDPRGAAQAADRGARRCSFSADYKARSAGGWWPAGFPGASRSLPSG